ncbi:NAD-dependent epimerase/dehydratase family protein [Halosimplex salinum]|uniref:NAD-dependent epimerase/dehydratase family protein n=1 Tax=Halosimplex salinum TaxID=1710538 RepID=UPI000F497F6A|nr:NAD-dependent epimerase/dehydratase family protein [Halosimplex salinum]
MRLDESTVLVTGGAGFVGSHLTERLADRGTELVVVDDLFAGRREYVPDDATFFEQDVRSDAFAETVRETDPDGIVHLAAIHHIPYCNANPEAAFEVNTMGTRNLLAAAEDLDDLEQVVFASTAAVYEPEDGPHRETDEPGPIDIYGRTKLVGEDLVEQFTTNTGVPAASARLFNVYGTNETNEHLIPAILDQLRDGSHAVELGNLSPARDFVHVTDVADALVALLTEFDADYRAYNVGTGTEHTVREVVEHTEAALGEPIEISQAEERVRESDRPHLCPSTERIEREIGWTPDVEFTDGLRELLEAEGIRT